jgi:hypothetical protein
MTVDSAERCPRGHPIAPGDAFCRTCGAPTAASEPVGTSGLRTLDPRWLIPVGVLLVVLLGVGAWVLAGKKGHTDGTQPESSGSKSSALTPEQECERIGMEFATAAITHLEGDRSDASSVYRLQLKYGTQDPRVQIAIAKVIPAAVQVLAAYGESDALAAASNASRKECTAYIQSMD